MLLTGRIWRAACASIVLLLAMESASAQRQAETQLTDLRASDLYVSCYLFVRDTDALRNESGGIQPWGAGWCALTALASLQREGELFGSANFGRYCLPETPAVSADPGRVIAFAYLDYYERNAATLANQRAVPYAFMAAMQERFPCP